MTTPVLYRSAATDAPVLGVLTERWSPRAYASDGPIDEAKLASALEAARWAPSASNTQPWRFVVARRGGAAHDAVHASLVGFNQVWAGNASVLIVAISQTADAEGRELRWASYDLGQAIAHLTVQAHHDELFVHQLGGFDRDAIRASFELDETLEPVTVIALGELGDTAALPEALQQREAAPRVRRPISESVIVNG